MVNGVTTDCVLDGPIFVRERSGGANVASYLFGPRGPEYRRDDSTGSIRWYCYDGLGSVLGEVDPNGNLTASRSYDVFGSVRTSAGASTSKHKFVGKVGHPSEDETGLVQMRARYMDPQLGRFMSQDKGGDGYNLFQYVDAQPTGRIDFDGRFGISDVSLSVALAEGVMSAGWDVIFQLLTGNGTIDWGEVGLAFGIGMAGGMVGHFARAAFYAKNPLARAAWEQANGSFATYFQKCLGIATGTSGSAGGRLWPIWRSLTSGAAARVFGLLYNSYLGAFMED